MKKSRFLWPLWRFWTFHPLGFIIACVWNLFELARKPMPFAPTAFGIICGRKGRRLS